MRLLLVEDDPELAAPLRQALRQAGYSVDWFDNGLDGEFMGTEIAYDAVILDLGLPDRSGLEVLRRWRAAGHALPVLILTARDAWHERVDGFKAGADDYLGKPFHVEELLARLTALIRRSKALPAGPLRVAGLELDEATQSVATATGERFELTGLEFRLLRCFMHNPGKLLSKNELLERLYAEDDELRDSNVLEVYVNRLRRKLGAGLIQTRRGQGYVFDAA